MNTFQSIDCLLDGGYITEEQAESMRANAGYGISSTQWLKIAVAKAINGGGEPPEPQPPINLVAPSITGTPRNGYLLTSNVGVWDFSPTSYTYQWQFNGIDIPGATNSTWMGAGITDGVGIRVIITAINADGQNQEPSNVLVGEVVVLSGTGYPGNNLNSTYAGQWKLNGVNVAGQTGTSLLIPYTVNPTDVYTQQDSSNSITIVAYDVNAATDIAAVLSAGSDWGDTNDRRPHYKWRYSELMRDLKAAGVYSALEFRYALAGPSTLAGTLVCGIGGGLTNFNFVSGDYSQKTGLKGDGSTKFLRTARAGDANAQDNFSWGCWVTQPPTTIGTVVRAFFGNSDTSAPGCVTLGKTNQTDVWVMRGKSGAQGGVSGLVSTALGFVGISRSSSTTIIFRGNQANQSIALPSDGNLSSVMDFFSRAGVRYSDSRMAFICGGAAVDQAALETCLQTYFTAINAIP